MDGTRERLSDVCDGVTDFFIGKGVVVEGQQLDRVKRSIQALMALEYDRYGEHSSDFLGLWTSDDHRVDESLANLYSMIFTEMVVPCLAGDYERNKLSLAYALCYVDSGELDEETRNNLGIKSNCLSFSNPPDLFRLTEDGGECRSWARQCPDGPWYLREVNNVAEGDLVNLVSGKWRSSGYDEKIGLLSEIVPTPGGINLIRRVPIVGFDTLVVCRTLDHYIFGLCTQTREIYTGERRVVFVEDVFYALRDVELVGRLNNVGPSNIVGNGGYEEGVDVDMGLIMLNGAIINWYELGGLWQPTVQLYDQPSMVIAEDFWRR